MSTSYNGRWVILSLLAAAVVVGVLVFQKPKEIDEGRLVVVPALSAQAAKGQTAFNGTCAACHGENAAGGPGGPSLVHAIYWERHHADGAIRLAVQRGVRAHHWGFGNMPPMGDKVSPQGVEDIIKFVRELQQANLTKN